MTEKTTKQILIEARGLIEKPEHWCRNYLCKLPSGAGQNGKIADDAVAFCMNGAIFKAADKRKAADKAIHLMEHITNMPTICFNDRFSHAEILGAFDKAIAIAA